MNEKEQIRNKIIKILYPPILYTAIMMIVQVIAEIIIYFIYSKTIGKEHRVTFSDSYQYLDQIEDILTKYNYLIMMISAVAGICIFGYLFMRDCKMNHEPDLKGQMQSIKKADWILLAGLGVFCSLGLSRFVSLLPLDNIIGNYDNTQKAILSGNIIIQILTVALLVPVAEELIYRGLVYKRLLSLIDEGKAMLLASLIFGLFHFNLLQGVYAFLLSLILIIVYIKYRSLMSCIIIHSSANLAAVLASYFKISDIFSKNMIIYVIIMLIELVISTIIFGIIVKKE